MLSCLSGASAVMATALAASLGAAPPAEQHIYGGEAAAACAWPSVVSLGQLCSGTLIHPRVVLYASHCGDNFDSVQFGEAMQPQHSRSVATVRCETWPSALIAGDGTDWAYCILADAQDNVPIVPPLMGCEMDEVQPGTPVTVVGFGRSEAGFGTKRSVTTPLLRFEVDDDGTPRELFLGGEGKDACEGDSGGPAFVQLADGTWRVVGITSYGSSNCQDGGYYSLVPRGMPWFEGRSDYDLTPCHDAVGNWVGGPRCDLFPSDPAAATAGADWSTSCAPATLQETRRACGAPFDPSTDSTPPQVSILSPDENAVFELPNGVDTMGVQVEVIANDPDGSGIAKVVLDAGGTPTAPMFVAPYAADLELSEGVYVLAASAVDGAGNMSAVAEVTITVRPGGTNDGDTSADDGGAQQCSCRSDGPRSPLPWLLVALVALVRRRRPPGAG